MPILPLIAEKIVWASAEASASSNAEMRGMVYPFVICCGKPFAFG
jgi:hypothetical protein